MTDRKPDALDGLDGEPAPSDAEAREARLLAGALELGADGGREPPADLSPIDDALGAAQLLRAARRGGLSELRERAVLAQVQGSAQARRPALRVAAGLSLAAGLAAAALLLARPCGAFLPAPSEALLRAQLAAARGGASLRPLEAELSAHRSRLFAALDAAYGGGR